MADQEGRRLSRFLFSDRHFSATLNIVKHGAFMPPKDRKLSVFDTDSLAEPSVWHIPDAIAEERQMTLYGRADLATTAVMNRGLRLTEAEPPPRHRHIEGWPTEGQKEDQKLIAIELAAEAVLSLA